MKKIKSNLKATNVIIFIFLLLSFSTIGIVGFGAAASAKSIPLPNVNLVAATTCSKPTFFGLVPWYQYLSFDSNCELNFNLLGNNKKSDVPLVLLAVIDDLLRVAGIATVFYILFGGVKYITSQGSPDETAKAQATILNSLIGLAVALIAVGVVSFIGKQFGAS